MADSCATCFYFRTGACHYDAPKSCAPTRDPSNVWPAVLPTDWCSFGIDATTHTSFTPKIQVKP